MLAVSARSVTNHERQRLLHGDRSDPLGLQRRRRHGAPPASVDVRLRRPAVQYPDEDGAVWSCSAEHVPRRTVPTGGHHHVGHGSATVHSAERVLGPARERSQQDLLEHAQLQFDITRGEHRAPHQAGLDGRGVGEAERVERQGCTGGHDRTIGLKCGRAIDSDWPKHVRRAKFSGHW